MLAVGAGLSAVAFAIAVVGLIVDPTVITGAPAWMKPAKFSFSIAVYLLTLRWILSYIRGHARLLAVLSTIIVVALVAEIVLVEMQVFRGTTSHYNEATDFDAAVFYAMGGIVTLVLIATIAAGVLALRQRGIDPGSRGRAALGHRHLRARHARGRHDDLQQGLERLGRTHGRRRGWRRRDADHRLEPRARRPADRTLHRAARPAAAAAARLGAAPVHALGCSTRARLLNVAGASYTAVVVLLVWQAFRGQSLVQPDDLTLGAVALHRRNRAPLAVAVVISPRGGEVRNAPSRNASASFFPAHAC